MVQRGLVHESTWSAHQPALLVLGMRTPTPCSAHACMACTSRWAPKVPQGTLSTQRCFTGTLMPRGASEDPQCPEVPQGTLSAQWCFTGTFVPRGASENPQCHAEGGTLALGLEHPIQPLPGKACLCQCMRAPARAAPACWQHRMCCRWACAPLGMHPLHHGNPLRMHEGLSPCGCAARSQQSQGLLAWLCTLECTEQASCAACAGLLVFGTDASIMSWEGIPQPVHGLRGCSRARWE